MRTAIETINFLLPTEIPDHGATVFGVLLLKNLTADRTNRSEGYGAFSRY